MDYFNQNRESDIVLVRIFCLVLFVGAVWLAKIGIEDYLLFSSNRYIDNNHVYCTAGSKNDDNKKAQILKEDSYVCEIDNAFAKYDQGGKLRDYKTSDPIRKNTLFSDNTSEGNVNFLTKIPSNNEEGFMIIAVEIDDPTKDEDEKLTKMISEYYFEPEKKSNTTLSGWGKVVKIHDNERIKIKKAVDKFGLTDIASDDIEYKLVISYYNKSMMWAKTYLACAFLLVMMMMALLLKYTNRNDIVQLEKTFEEKEVEIEEVKKDLDNGDEYRVLRVGKRYAMGYQSRTKFIDGKELAWVYPKKRVKTHWYRWTIPVYKEQPEYSIGYITFSGEKEEIYVGKNKFEFGQLMEAFLKIAPGVLYGENPEWKKLYNTNKEEFYEFARQRREKAEHKE